MAYLIQPNVEVVLDAFAEAGLTWLSLEVRREIEAGRVLGQDEYDTNPVRYPYSAADQAGLVWSALERHVLDARKMLEEAQELARRISPEVGLFLCNDQKEGLPEPYTTDELSQVCRLLLEKREPLVAWMQGEPDAT